MMENLVESIYGASVSMKLEFDYRLLFGREETAYRYVNIISSPDFEFRINVSELEICLAKLLI